MWVELHTIFAFHPVKLKNFSRNLKWNCINEKNNQVKGNNLFISDFTEMCTRLCWFIHIDTISTKQNVFTAYRGGGGGGGGYGYGV